MGYGKIVGWVMKILQIVPMLNFGGVETGTVDLSIRLIQKGHSVIVVSGGGKMVKDLLDVNARHINLPVYKKSLFTIIHMIKKLRKIIVEERVDIVHARSRVPAIIAFFAARHTRAKFITTAHGYYSKHIFSRVMGWGKFVIVASGVIGRHMINDFKVPRERIRFIPRGVDLEKFRFKAIDINQKKSEYKIGVIGRITPIKGHAFFLQAVARVVRIFGKVKILIVGDAPKDKPEYKEELKALITKLGIEEYVEFTGSSYNIPKIMSEIDLLVLPSVGQEAFGRVIIEAGASGVPVIATRIGGIVDIVENKKTGILVKPGDIIELVDSMLMLLKDRELAKNIALEARTKVEKEYNLERMVGDTIKVYEDALKIKNILIIKIGAIGDVILAVPSIRAIRSQFTNAHICVLVGKESRQILRNCPYIDDIILYDKKGRDKNITGLLKIAHILRAGAFEMSIDLQNNKASHLVAWLSGIPERFGYNNKKMGFLLNHAVRYSRYSGDGPVEDQFRILRAAGVNTNGMSKRLEIWPVKRDFFYVDNFLQKEWVSDSQLLVGINLGSTWKTKRWPLKHIARLSDMLSAKDIRVVITGSESEKELADELDKMVRTKLINAVGKTSITQLAALIKRCAVFITGDSAPMHIASSMGIDFIALFGPTAPERHFEATEKGTVVKKDLNCSPCYKADCKKIICMKKISVDEVYKLVVKKMKDAI